MSKVPITKEITVEEALKEMQERVLKLHQDLQAFRKNPGTWDILITYLYGKGHKMNEVKSILNGVEEFMRKFLPPQKP